MCGLYGIINNGPRLFRRDLFEALGIINDRRGGDSCGVFIDGKVEYGIGNRALFENFFWDSELLNNTEVCEIALGHDRKASVGAITVEKAHPIIIKNDNGETDFVLIHNGTIYNYEELAEEYIPDIDCSKFSDSQTLALILYHSGFDVLEKYNGGTAFVAVDYRKGYPETFMYKGCSKNTSLAVEATVERPLYFSYNNTGITFSSIASILCALNDTQVYEAKDNKVYKYVKGKLYTIRTIDRSKCQQTKIYKYNNNYYGTTGINTFQFMKYSESENLYYGENGKLLTGKHRISVYGRILRSEDNPKQIALKVFVVYFFNGIPFRDKYTYNIINRQYKKSHLTIDEFVKRNIVFIRFYAADQIFMDNNTAYIATSETGFKPFDGTLYPLGRAMVIHFKLGSRGNSIYGQDSETPFVKGGFVEAK